MNRISVVTFAFALVFTSAAFASQPAEKLSKQQLAILVATAKTPAEHTRIAAYYAAEAQNEMAQAKVHEQMAARYKQNPAASSAKFATGTVNHCEYLAQHMKQDAFRLQSLAEEHEKMAHTAQN